VKYAQRADSLYVTVELADVTNDRIKVTKDSVSVGGTSGGREYWMDVKLWKKIRPQETIVKVLPRNIQIWLKKETAEDEYWPRILQDRAFEKKHLSIDWDRWKDEDDCEAGAFDTSALGGGG
ncbi:HSP20-like chaperone, partial [Baffinella frigidus]